MSANLEALMGEVNTQPEEQRKDIDLLLQSFLRALIEEQDLKRTPPLKKEAV